MYVKRSSLKEEIFIESTRYSDWWLPFHLFEWHKNSLGSKVMEMLSPKARKYFNNPSHRAIPTARRSWRKCVFISLNKNLIWVRVRNTWKSIKKQHKTWYVKRCKNPFPHIPISVQKMATENCDWKINKKQTKKIKIMKIAHTYTHTSPHRRCSLLGRKMLVSGGAIIFGTQRIGAIDTPRASNRWKPKFALRSS